MVLTTPTSDIKDLMTASSGLIGTLAGHKLPRNVLICEVSDDPHSDRKVVQWITNERTSDNRRYARKTTHAMPFDGTEEGALAVLAAMKLTD